MADRRALSVQTFIDGINEYADAGRWYMVATMAEDTWPVLLPAIQKLHPVAQTAVRHYAAEAKRRARAKPRSTTRANRKPTERSRRD